MAHTVLIADDSRTIRQIVGMALKAQPYQIVEAGSARQAMEALQRGPDIVLLDYYMPDGSGYEICRAIKSNAATQGIPVVMLGGTYQNFDESMARQAGADDVIWKPFKTDELVAAIVRAVGMLGAAPAQPQAAPSRPAPPPNPFASGRPQPPAQPQPARPAQPTPAPQQPYQRPAATTTSGSQPRIPSQAPQSSRPAPSSSPDINASAIKPQAAPVQPSSPGIPPATAGLDREALSEMITEEVRATVRKELPGLLRNVMGELIQQKIMPRLMQHVDERVNASFGQLDERIQAQVRSELETLLEDL
jgi:CheY-like chemotaxis protein